MSLSIIEVIALIFVLAGIAKMLIVLASRDSWAKFVKKLYNKPNVLMIVQVVLLAIVMYYLLKYLTIVQIMAGVVVGALLTGMIFSAYGKELMSPMLKLLKANAWKKAWLPILVWIILMIWTLAAIFGYNFNF